MLEESQKLIGIHRNSQNAHEFLWIPEKSQECLSTAQDSLGICKECLKSLGTTRDSQELLPEAAPKEPRTAAAGHKIQVNPSNAQ